MKVLTEKTLNMLTDFILANRMQVLEKFHEFDVPGIDAQIRWPAHFFIPPTEKGKLLLVAHIDTVWRDVGNVIPRIQENIMYNGLIVDHITGKTEEEQRGLGADDRLGVATLYRFLTEDMLNGHGILLCDGEEYALGSYIIGKRLRKQLEQWDFKFLVELDYPGVGVFTTYNGESKQFVKSVEEVLNLTRVDGSFSDITALGQELNKYSINLSIGYSRPHRINEFIELDHWNYMMEKLRLLLLHYDKIQGAI